MIATQIYHFVAPGLYKNERQAFLPYLIATPIFFAAGAMLVYFGVMPLLIRFSVSLQQVGQPGEATIELLPKVNEYLSLIMTLVFAFGAAFQLPVVLTLLGQVGIINSQMADRRCGATPSSCVTGIAAILTPPDLISMTLAGAADAAALRGRGHRGEDDRAAPRGGASQESVRPLDTLAAVVAAVVWGLTFIAIKYGVEAAPPFLLTALRFAFAAFPLVLFVKPPQAPWRLVALYGAADRRRPVRPAVPGVREGMPVGLASLVIQIQVYFTILLAALLLGERPTRRTACSAARRAWRAWRSSAAARWGHASLVAVLADAWRRPSAGARAISSASGSAASIPLRSSLGRASPRRCRCWRCLSRRRRPRPSQALTHPTLKLALSVASLAYGGTLFSYTLWARLLAKYPAAAVTPFALLVPVAGMAAAAVVFDERPSAAEYFGRAGGDAGAGAQRARRPARRRWRRRAARRS